MAAALNIVVVEDHDVLREVTVTTLRSAGHHVTGLTCAEEIDDEGGKGPIDVLVVDLNLPSEDGLSLARRFRAAQPLAGIVMTTARTEIHERVEGYASGADIYLSKPVHPGELLAADEALGRRVEAACVVQGGDASQVLTLHTDRLRLEGPQAVTTITASESTLLAALARAPGHQLETWQLLEVLGEDPDEYAKAAFEVRMGRLRKKLVAVGATPTCLRAVRGIGYQLCDPLQVV